MAEDKKEVDILLDDEASESTATDKNKVDIVLEEDLPPSLTRKNTYIE